MRVAIKKDGNEKEAVLRDSNEVSVFRVVNRAIYVVSAVSVIQSVTNVAKLVTYKKLVIASLEESLTIVVNSFHKKAPKKTVHCLEEVADMGSEETGSQEELFKINSTSRHQPSEYLWT